MQRGLEDPRIESRRGRRVGHDDVEMLQAQVVERKRRGGRALRDHPDRDRGGHHRCKNRVSSKPPGTFTAPRSSATIRVEDGWIAQALDRRTQSATVV